MPSTLHTRTNTPATLHMTLHGTAGCHADTFDNGASAYLRGPRRQPRLPAVVALRRHPDRRLLTPTSTGRAPTGSSRATCRSTTAAPSASPRSGRSPACGSARHRSTRPRSTRPTARAPESPGGTSDSPGGRAPGPRARVELAPVQPHRVTPAAARGRRSGSSSPPAAASSAVSTATSSGEASPRTIRNAGGGGRVVVAHRAPFFSWAPITGGCSRASSGASTRACYAASAARG